MIWFILGIAPFVIILILAFISDPEVFLATAATVVGVCALMLLAIYGAWQMDWFEHCGNFWESYTCP
jgi:hypothetical protein